MAEQLQFKISSELKNIIGKELITDDFIAIFELVKNSYDANASRVDIVFKHVKNRTKQAKIFVIDNGDGMSRADLESKWLVVGYSWKVTQQEELESEDFRDKIGRRRIFAGAKGIGRFSCDRLGSRLRLFTKKADEAVIHVINMDWEMFEEDPAKEFQTIDVVYSTCKELDIEVEASDFTSGTILEVSSLREKWSRDKLVRLKRHLQRLINPAQVSEAQEFRIFLTAEEFLEEDKRRKEYDKVNGIVRNILFERLNIKTTQINCDIDESGDMIETKLIDKATFIYRIEEENEYHPLHDISIRLFYLNPSAKATFTRTMGIPPVRYGSVFFYKNGVKINPCGNEGDDWLGLDRRKTQGTRRFLGNRDVMGRIEVSGHQPYFREVSSRDGGVIKTPQLGSLKDLFKEKVLARLERYVVEGIAWDSEKRPKDPEEVKADGFRLISQLADSATDDMKSLEFNENLLEIYEKKQVDKTPQLIKNIEYLKKHVKTKEERSYVDTQAKAARKAFRALRKRERELERELERRTLFLERVGEEKAEIMALQHQIGLGATIIKNHLAMLKDKMEREEPISDEYLLSLIDTILLQTQMMSSITSFVTKAKFDLKTQQIEGDLALFIRQYLERIYIPYNEVALDEERVTIKVDCDPDAKFDHVFNPFKFIVIIDNLISNSRKAKARQIDVKMDVLDKNTMELRIKDDGIGIPDEDVKQIFNFGFSTTDGSGIGLYHVKKIMEDYGSVAVNNRLDKGVEFIIRVTK